MSRVGFSIWAGLLFLLALPLALLAIFNLGKLFSPTSLTHMALEFLLVVAAAAGLLSPLTLTSQSRSLQFRVLVASTVAVCIAIAGLFSPLYGGFIH